MNSHNNCSLSSKISLPLALLFSLVIAALAFGQVVSDPQTPPSQPESSAENETQEKIAYVLMKTTKGDIVLELNREKAPISVANFLSYVEKDHYDGTIFHRVIPNFMIQGGGFDAGLNEKPTDPPIKNEWTNGLKNERGTIAMARRGDSKPNPERVNSATCQFFINVVDTARLDEPQPDGGAYAVFGKVVAGMKTVDDIKVVPTTVKRAANGTPMQNVPVEPVTIESVRKISEEEAKTMIEAEQQAKPAPAQPKSE